MISATKIVWRGFILFSVGTIFTYGEMLQTQKQTGVSQSYIILETIRSQWWLPIICGSVSALVGLIYPCIGYKFGNKERSQEWSRVLRCIAMFIGINEAYTKIDFPSNLQLCFSLIILSVSMWWYFDRTTIGFGMFVAIAVIATFISQMLVYHKVYEYSEREYFYMRSWLPCVVFSGAITIGNIGKQLAVNDFAENENKAHTE